MSKKPKVGGRSRPDVVVDEASRYPFKMGPPNVPPAGDLASIPQASVRGDDVYIGDERVGSLVELDRYIADLTGRTALILKTEAVDPKNTVAGNYAAGLASAMDLYDQYAANTKGARKMTEVGAPGTESYRQMAEAVKEEVAKPMTGQPLDFIRKTMKFEGGVVKVDHAKMLEEMKRQYGEKFTSEFGSFCSGKFNPRAAVSPQQQREIEQVKEESIRAKLEVERLSRENAEMPKLRETLTATEREHEKTQKMLKEYIETFEKLKKMPLPHASVIAVHPETVVIATGGRNIEVERPVLEGKLLDFAIGDTVKVAGDTMQIVEHAKNPPTAGEVLTVCRIVNETTAEVDRQGSQRAVTYSPMGGVPLEEMDRVVLDASATVVVANLGKPADMGLVQEETGVTWDDIGGLDAAKRELREALEAPILHAEKMRRYGKKPAKGALLYGGPGLGKTMLGKAAATALAELHSKIVSRCTKCRAEATQENMNGVCGGSDGQDGTPHQWMSEKKATTSGGFFYVKGPALLDKFVGETEASIRKLFGQARAYKKKTGFPAIIFIDEAEAILGPRSVGGSFNMSNASKGFLSQTVVPQFLSEMDGLQESGAFVLLATNRPSSIDSAIVRDGRIDRRIKVTRPSKYDARAILQLHLKKTPLDHPEDRAIDVITEALYDPKLVLYRVKKQSSVGKGVAMTLSNLVSGAMLAGIVDRATSLAMRRGMTTVAESFDQELDRVKEEDLREAVEQVMWEARDVNHDDELAEFTDGWADEVTGITRENSSLPQVAKEAS